MMLGLMFGCWTREVELSPIGDSADDAFVTEYLEAGVATDAGRVSWEMSSESGKGTYSLMACVLPGRTWIVR